MTLESEFLEMPPETYEETLRMFAGIAAKGAQALGEPIPGESQEIFDAPVGSLAAAKRAADSARERAAQVPASEAGDAKLDERKKKLTRQRATQEVQEAVAQVLHLNIDDIVVRPQTPHDAIHSFEVWPAAGDLVGKSGDEDVPFIPFLPPDAPPSPGTAGAPFIVHSFDYGDDLAEFVLVDHSSTSEDEHRVLIVDLVDGKYIAKKAESDADKVIEKTADAFSRAQKSATAAWPPTSS